MTTKILCIDDEPNILDGYRRSLRRQFEIDTASGGAEALRKIAESGPYAVLVTDMRMPGMDGIEFLKQAQAVAPDSVRMMLTGNADQHTAAEAVNRGHVFRFLNKPCPPEELAQALNVGLEQYRLITAEKELLEKTLGGSIRMLIEILGMVDPELFGRAQTLRQNMRLLTAALQAADAVPPSEPVWALDLAALLAEVGAVAVPSGIARKVQQRAPMTQMEQKIWQRVPETGYQLLRNIPRLEPVAEAIRYQHKHFDGGGTPEEAPEGYLIPLGARMLKVLLDLMDFQAMNVSRPGAFITMQRQASQYDPQVLAAAVRCLGGVPEEAPEPTSTPISLSRLCCGHILVADVESLDGRVLLPAGRQVTDLLLQKLNNYAALAGIKEPLRVQAAF